jgi:hypothetical protein
MNRKSAYIAAGALALLATGPVLAQPGPEAEGPSAAIARNNANWAEWEADKRVTEGDYDGAVQAQARADADRRAAQRMDAYARAPDPKR